MPVIVGRIIVGARQEVENRKFVERNLIRNVKGLMVVFRATYSEEIVINLDVLVVVKLIINVIVEGPQRELRL